ncbi:hypothetical protein H1C71_027643 [Ictidomys tridecemlineatus]|nr:hypothetical protein H1C71_027643 [Ictidomys tridecemlineatus]
MRGPLLEKKGPLVFSPLVPVGGERGSRGQENPLGPPIINERRKSGYVGLTGPQRVSYNTRPLSPPWENACRLIVPPINQPYSAPYLLLQRQDVYYSIMVDFLDRWDTEVLICLLWIKWMGLYLQKWNLVKMIPKSIFVIPMCLIHLSLLKPSNWLWFCFFIFPSSQRCIVSSGSKESVHEKRSLFSFTSSRKHLWSIWRLFSIGPTTPSIPNGKCLFTEVFFSLSSSKSCIPPPPPHSECRSEFPSGLIPPSNETATEHPKQET